MIFPLTVVLRLNKVIQYNRKKKKRQSFQKHNNGHLVSRVLGVMCCQKLVRRIVRFTTIFFIVSSVIVVRAKLGALAK